MGMSVTRIVKFIRKGKGVIVAQSRNVYNYTYKEWTQFYGLSGRSVNWDGIINVSDFSVGDTMVINGTVSDKQRITISLYAKVTAIDTNRAIITAQSLYYIASGENGEDGAKGDRGPALRGPQAWSDCAVGYVFQSGASGEEYKDVVLYGGYYYSCIKSHTKTASNNPGSATDTNSGLWKLADPVEIVATKILLAQYALVKNLGVEAIDMKDANGNIIFQAKDGNVTCNSGTFKNITVKGNSSFEGSVKANMFYGTVRKVTPGSTYTIDPVNEPYNFYYVENPTKRTFIVLPKAANYDGLEINIFTKMPPSSSLSYRTIVKAQGNDDFYVKQNAAIVSSNIAVEKLMLSTPILKTTPLQRHQTPIYALSVLVVHGMRLADNLQENNLVIQFRLWQ